MRHDLQNIVGKQIKGVVVTEGQSDPRSQVFLIFSDETYYEFYSPCAISWTSYAYSGGLEEVKNYMPHQGIIVEVCDDNLGGKGAQRSMRHLLKVLRDTWGRMSFFRGI